MGRSYKQCVECGKRALSIATRCPGCGRELLTPAVPEGVPARGLGRFLSPRLAVGVLAAAAILIAARLAQTAVRRERSPSRWHQSSDLGYATAPTTPPDTASVTALPAEGAGELLVTRTWTSVRKSRSKAADLEAVLLPGDTVLADSLERGWYRVALEGEVLGYVHRSTLKEARPGTLRLAIAPRARASLEHPLELD